MLKYLKNKKENLLLEVGLSEEKLKVIKEKYPNKIPIVVFTNESINIDRRKYLVDENFLFSELMTLFRRRISGINEAEGLYMFIGDKQKMVPLSKRINEVFDENDKYLKITLTKENTFG